jgi:ATP-dependent RNA helicase DDX51/DBP6
MSRKRSRSTLKSVDDDIVDNLPEPMRRALRKQLGVKALFPMQRDVIRAVLGQQSDEKQNGDEITIELASDVCVCAPTGSGKTLCYAIPLVKLFDSKSVKRVRAVVLVPTRELVGQVQRVFEALCKGTSVGVVALSGQAPFALDQSLLVQRNQDFDFNDDDDLVLHESNEAWRYKRESSSSSSSPSPSSSLSFESKCDIVIATPGRLVDHIDYTPGFSLEHLEFLVIDEADRLLMQRYDDWLVKVLGASQCAARPRETPYRLRAENSMTQRSALRKLLFSATLTKNPEKIAMLELRHPRVMSFAERQRFKLPAELRQSMSVCEASDKPLLLYHLVLELRRRQSAADDGDSSALSVLCFASSVDSTHRLCVLLRLMLGADSVAEFSSSLGNAERAALLERFRAGDVQLLVCSDVAARGLDIADVSHVFNYDAPTHIKTYVHRVGRTARAGRRGRAYTLLLPHQVHHFRKMLRKADHTQPIESIDIDAKALDQHANLYRQSLEQLELEVSNKPQHKRLRTLNKRK